MIPVRPLGFCVVSINNLTRSCCRLNTASGFPFRRWQSQSASLGIIHDCNAENIPGRGLAPALDNFHLHPEKQRSFSIISDHYEPSVRPTLSPASTGTLISIEFPEMGQEVTISLAGLRETPIACVACYALLRENTRRRKSIYS